MTDEELIARLRSACFLAFDDGTNDYGTAPNAADRIEGLVKGRQAAYAEGFSDAETEISATAIGQQNAFLHDQLARAKARIKLLEAALREIAAEASVPVRTKKKGGIKHKWMYRGWRKIAVERIDIARAALKGADHE